MHACTHTDPHMHAHAHSHTHIHTPVTYQGNQDNETEEKFDLVMAFGDGIHQLLIWQFFNLLLSLKQQNLMKIMFSCIPFPVWPYPPKIMEKINKFYTG